MLFAQVPAALFLLLAVTLLEDRPMAAGIAAGMALSCFYVCALTAVILPAIAYRYHRRTAARFILGVVPFTILMAIYQWICFGSPFRTSVEASTQFTDSSLIFGVIRVPSVEALYGITVSPYRGLFFVSPVLLLAFVGFSAMKRDRRFWSLVVLVSAYVLTITSFNGWDGGWAFGPRYLVPIVPLLGIAMMATRLRPWWIVAAILSVGLNFIATATDPMPSTNLAHPVSRYLVPAFFTGHIGERTRRSIGYYETQSVDNVSLARDSGNLGEYIFGKGKRASVIPIVVWLTAGFAVLLRMSLRKPERLLVE